MQLGSSAPPPVAAVVAPPTPAPAPAREFSSRTVLPRELQVARIGKGSVASEIDRSIRVLLEGQGPASTRAIVPDSKAAAQLMASEHGPTFEQAIRAFVSVADAHEGKENLRSITFVPDEHASKGVSVLNRTDSLARSGFDVDAMLDPTEYRVGLIRKEIPELSRPQIRAQLRRYAAAEIAKLITEGEAQTVAFAGAWNGDGHIVMTPDVSREMLATLGLYRIQPGDSATKLPLVHRDDKARWTWHAAIHEAHHSITPNGPRGPEWESVMEEAVPEVLTPKSIDPTLRRAGANPALAARPARDTASEPVNWAAWNRDHLPKPSEQDMDTADGRYTDGPELVRQLLRLAGIDRRTTGGQQAAIELLQGDVAGAVPTRIAGAIASRHGLDDATADQLVDLIRRAAVGDGTISDIRQLIDGTEAGHAGSAP